MWWSHCGEVGNFEHDARVDTILQLPGANGVDRVIHAVGVGAAEGGGADRVQPLVAAGRYARPWVRGRAGGAGRCGAVRRPLPVVAARHGGLAGARLAAAFGPRGGAGGARLAGVGRQPLEREQRVAHRHERQV
ncbi:hypothetical protein, partial [Burkholderia pseudomallei]|uniref:hypothetical protein n=1 Tax=Burkholderia pseudomallei TaxID=28450 RepID=UPI000CCF9C2A